MHFNNAYIHALSYVDGPEVISSADIERTLEPLYSRLNLPDGRLELMTGIQERRFWPASTPPSQIATLAGQKALESASISPSDIGLLVHSSVCRDLLEPATASFVHKNLSLPPSAQIFDLSNACLGFLNAIQVAANFIESNAIDHALVVSGENGRGLLDHTLDNLTKPHHTRQSIKPLFANLTIGGGAAAAIISRTPSNIKINHAVSLTDSSANELCQGDSAGDSSYLMNTDSEALLQAGVAIASKTWDQFKALTGWADDTPEVIISHQVGKRHQTAIYEALNIDPAKDFSTFPTLGNMGSASLPVTLAKAIEADFVHDGDLVALLGIGSGLATTILSLQC